MRSIQTARSLMFSNNMVILATLILPSGVLAVPDGAATPAQQQMVREPAEPQEQNMTDTVVIAPTHTGKRIVPPYDPTNPPKPKMIKSSLEATRCRIPTCYRMTRSSHHQKSN